jgi:hypothetical protein
MHAGVLLLGVHVLKLVELHRVVASGVSTRGAVGGGRVRILLAS